MQLHIHVPASIVENILIGDKCYIMTITYQKVYIKIVSDICKLYMHLLEMSEQVCQLHVLGI